MAETIVAFQTQLSGVMETVFKAAMFEITRLVEESFLEEVTRCREQVDALKRKLTVSESRREDELDHKVRCSDCGRVSFEETVTKQTDKPLKQECDLGQDEIITSSKDSELSAGLEASVNMTTSQCLNEKQFEEENLHNYKTEEQWADCSNESETNDVTGKRRINEKCRVDWEANFSSSTESNQNINTSEDLFPNKYTVEDLAGYDKKIYGVAMENLQGSPTHLAEELSFIHQYDDALEAERMGQQAFQTVAERNRSSSLGTLSKADASRAFNCLLIDEEGFPQDHSCMQVTQSSNQPNVKLRGQNQGAHLDATVRDIYSCSETYQTRGASRQISDQSIAFSGVSSVKAHKQTDKSSGQGMIYPCPDCGKTFTQACNLKVHQKIHSNHCSHCGKTFSSFFELKKHKCGQMINKPYCCSICGNKFSRLWNLKLHQRIHTQEKPHQCSMCDKSFTRADILKVHHRTHTGERPYSCMVCGLSFKRLDHLKSHQRKHLTS